MDAANERRAADLLAAGRASATPVTLPPALRPTDETSGYNIQAWMVDYLDGHAVGYKIGASSKEAQQFLGLQSPFWGRLIDIGCHDSPAHLRSDDFILRLIEPEFSFFIKSNLPPRSQPYDEQTVANAIDCCFPSIEVVSSAYGSTWRLVGAPMLIADNGVHGALIAGPECHDWRNYNLAVSRVRLYVDGELVGEGEGANALGGPLKALTWLANDLSKRGLGLWAGEAVATGVVTPFVELEQGQRALADFGDMGKVEVFFD